MKNTKKTLLCMMMALILVLGVTACTKKEEPAAEPQQEGFSADEMIGTWADNVAGRANLEIAAAEEAGRYTIKLTWGNGAAETYQWTMTAEPTENNVLYYSDCVKTIITFAENGSEEKTEEVYTGGHGQFVLLSTNEIQWTDDIENAGEDVLFISAK